MGKLEKLLVYSLLAMLVSMIVLGITGKMILAHFHLI